VRRRGCAVALAAALLCAVAALPRAALAHGGLAVDEDRCKLRVGRWTMHFAGYQPDSTAAKEFCEDIPQTGRIVVVLDNVDDELRDLPTEVRIIRDTGDESNLEAVTVLHVAPKTYPTGSLSFEHVFAQPGRFVGLVTVGQRDPKVSRFPFEVGRTGSPMHYALPLLAALAVGVAFYLYALRRRRLDGAPTA
jgi:hypothetical protein